MRVILDANVYISYLLSANPTGTITRIVETTLLSDDIDLLLPPELIREIVTSAMSKPYIRNRVTDERIESVLAMVASSSELLPESDEDFVRYVRDHKDDYLVAYSLINHADYLVTGDQDLLVLGQVHDLEIVSPATYLTILVQQS